MAGFAIDSGLVDRRVAGDTTPCEELSTSCSALDPHPSKLLRPRTILQFVCPRSASCQWYPEPSVVQYSSRLRSLRLGSQCDSTQSRMGGWEHHFVRRNHSACARSEHLGQGWGGGPCQRTAATTRREHSASVWRGRGHGATRTTLLR